VRSSYQSLSLNRRRPLLSNIPCGGVRLSRLWRDCLLNPKFDPNPEAAAATSVLAAPEDWQVLPDKDNYIVICLNVIFVQCWD
jgi:hypothetical protein